MIAAWHLFMNLKASVDCQGTRASVDRLYQRNTAASVKLADLSGFHFLISINTSPITS